MVLAVLAERVRADSLPPASTNNLLICSRSKTGSTSYAADEFMDANARGQYLVIFHGFRIEASL